ncbi:MAG: hypothetical protein C4323_08490 [Mastigocladus sp. ERB_26_2]
MSGFVNPKQISLTRIDLTLAFKLLIFQGSGVLPWLDTLSSLATSFEFVNYLRNLFSAFFDSLA